MTMGHDGFTSPLLQFGMSEEHVVGHDVAAIPSVIGRGADATAWVEVFRAEGDVNLTTCLALDARHPRRPIDEMTEHT
jgi:hypothetical protein